MSYSSMTLKNVMGGCELVDFKPPETEKSLFIDLSLIGVNLHELQKNLVPNLNHNQYNTEVENFNTAVWGSELRGESCRDESKDDNNNVFSMQQIDDKVIKSITQSEPAKIQCNLELFDFNANKVVRAQPSDLPQPAFTSIQNFYETFDVSDQIETMSDMENIADTPSSTSTFDSSYEQELMIYEPSIVYRHNFEVASTVTSTSIEDQYELHFIPTAVNSQDLTHPILAREKITKRGVQDFDRSNESLESTEKKRKLAGRAWKKKPSVEKNISCSRCNKKFRTVAHLKVHFKVHMDSECIHRCTICEQRFCHRGALTLHTRKHTPRPAYGIP